MAAAAATDGMESEETVAVTKGRTETMTAAVAADPVVTMTVAVAADPAVTTTVVVAADPGEKRTVAAVMRTMEESLSPGRIIPLWATGATMRKMTAAVTDATPLLTQGRGVSFAKKCFTLA